MQFYIIEKDGKVLNKKWTNTPRVYTKIGAARGAAANLARIERSMHVNSRYHAIHSQEINWQTAMRLADEETPSLEDYIKRYVVKEH